MELVGSVSAWLNAEADGVVQLSAFKDCRWLEVSSDDGVISIRIHESIGLQLSGLLLLVASQNRELRRSSGATEPALFARIHTTAVGLVKADEQSSDWLGVACLPIADDAAALDDEDDQWNVRIAEPFAELLALSILDRLGEISATLAMRRKNER